MPAETHCRVCPAPVEDAGPLCGPCNAELLCHVMAAEPEPTMRHCDACGAPYSYTEARVVRSLKSPGKGNQETPRLCWICEHLHYSAMLAPQDHMPA